MIPRDGSSVLAFCKAHLNCWPHQITVRGPLQGTALGQLMGTAAVGPAQRIRRAGPRDDRGDESAQVHDDVARGHIGAGGDVRPRRRMGPLRRRHLAAVETTVGDTVADDVRRHDRGRRHLGRHDGLRPRQPTRRRRRSRRWSTTVRPASPTPRSRSASCTSTSRPPARSSGSTRATTRRRTRLRSTR